MSTNASVNDRAIFLLYVNKFYVIKTESNTKFKH